MSKFDFDLLTIGAGSGGVAASRRAAALGARVGLVEDDRVGGTCVLRGCVPKKLLVYASEYASALVDAVGFGWEIGEHSIDWGRLVEAKDRELKRLNQIYLRMLEGSGVSLIRGRGEVVGPHEIRVGDERYTAALGSDFDRDELAKYVDVCGIRIEDDVLITADGCESLTCDVPKSPSEVQKAVAG